MMNKETLNLLRLIGTAALWAALPIGVVVGLSAKAFAAIFPDWFFPYGVALQAGLWWVTFIAFDKHLPQEGKPCRIGAAFLIFAPVPMYILLSGTSDYSSIERIQSVSPYIALGLPLLFLLLLPLMKRFSSQDAATP